MRNLRIIAGFCLLVALAACGENDFPREKSEGFGAFSDSFSGSRREKPPLAEIASNEIRKALESATRQIETTKNYTQEYFVIKYLNGDVPPETGARENL
jgi:hypothetical protein